MNMGDRDRSFLSHIIDSCNRIDEYLKGKSQADFLEQRMMQDAIIRNPEIIGEAANRLTPEFTQSHSTIVWREIVGLRHRLVHGYMSVNLNTVWNVVVKELPRLAAAVRKLLDAEK